jgi:hypothetical protein
MNKFLQRLEKFWFVAAPPERLAMLRILVGAFTLQYVGARYGMYYKVANSHPALFDPVGVAALLMQPLPPVVFQFILIATLAANIAFILGWRYRYSGPLFGVLLLVVQCYRNSWSMIYHQQRDGVARRFWEWRWRHGRWMRSKIEDAMPEIIESGAQPVGNTAGRSC